MAADEVIEVSNPNDLLRDFFDFGDDLILPDKPFDIKKESATFIGGDFDGHFDESSHDFFLGASTPSPSSSSTTSSSAVPNASSSSRFQSAISSEMILSRIYFYIQNKYRKTSNTVSNYSQTKLF